MGAEITVIYSGLYLVFDVYSLANVGGCAKPYPSYGKPFIRPLLELLMQKESGRPTLS